MDNKKSALQQQIEYTKNKLNSKNNFEETIEEVVYEENYNNISDEELLIREYVYENYDSISNKIFSIPAFLFGSLYFCYRKMFLYGMLYFIISMIINHFTTNLLIFLAMRLLIGFLFNKLYLLHVKNKVNDICKEFHRKSTDELRLICSNKGGPSVGYLALGIVIELIVYIILVLTASIVGIITIITRLFSLIFK